MADLDAKERRGRNADHRKRMFVERHRSPDHSRIASEFALPESIADDRAKVPAARFVIRGSERPSKDGIHSEDRKEVATHVQALGPASLAALRKVEPLRAPR